MAAKKKIALCLEYPLALRGGVSVLVEALLEGLAGHYEMAIASPDTSEELARSPLRPLIQAHLPWQPELAAVQTARTLAHGLAEAGVQLAHFQFGGNFGGGSRLIGHCPIPRASRLGVATVSTVHSFRGILDGFCGPQKPLLMKLALLPAASLGKAHVLRHVRREVAVSQSIHRELRRWYWPWRGKFTQIYHSRLRAAEATAPGAARERLILNVGYLARVKGQAVLAEAFARIAPRHPEWKLCLAGPVAEEATAQQIARIAREHRLQDRILLPGEIRSVGELLGRAAIYAQPSLSEALGLALQEAMFHGCAAIGARTGGIPELIDDGKTGLLVEAGNPEPLADALENLMANPQLRENFSRLGKAAIVRKGMTAEQMVRHHVELYESILQNR